MGWGLGGLWAGVRAGVRAVGWGLGGLWGRGWCRGSLRVFRVWGVLRGLSGGMRWSGWLRRGQQQQQPQELSEMPVNALWCRED